MQKKSFDILVQTALTVGLFWTTLKLTPKSALLSFTILYTRGKILTCVKNHKKYIVEMKGCAIYVQKFSIPCKIARFHHFLLGFLA